MRWHREAACRNHPFPDDFWPKAIMGTPTAFPLDTLPMARAKAVCAACPVRETCLEWALENPADAHEGIWGGLTVAERRRLARDGQMRLSA